MQEKKQTILKKNIKNTKKKINIKKRKTENIQKQKK